MITLEEKIKYHEEVANSNERLANEFEMTEENRQSCRETVAEHRQYVEWLKRLKHLEDCIKGGSLIGCINCKYDYLDIDDYPCRECCRECRKQYWEGKEDVKS